MTRLLALEKTGCWAALSHLPAQVFNMGIGMFGDFRWRPAGGRLEGLKMDNGIRFQRPSFQRKDAKQWKAQSRQ
jgi:hypothetical protein